MGSFFSKLFSRNAKKHTFEEEKEVKKYSWEREREKLDPKDYMIQKETGSIVGRLPGKVNGQQMIIENCEECNIYIYDYTNTVTVDDCKNCFIFLGPSSGSVFIRDCHSMKVVTACQQFRTRDCHEMQIYLCCTSQPIIESSSSIKLGCFSYFYPSLAEQFRKSGISPYNNNWSNIHDFTPVTDGKNWTLFPWDSEVAGLPQPPSSLSPITNEDNSGSNEKQRKFEIDFEVSTERSRSVVPRTSGKVPRTLGQNCLVVIFRSNSNRNLILSILKRLQPLTLVRTADISMTATEAKRIFGARDVSLVEGGSVVALEYFGEDCIPTCHLLRQEIQSNDVAISENKDSASAEIEAFFNFFNMQMSI